MKPPAISTGWVYVGAAVHAFYEVVLILLPVTVWAVVLISVGAPDDEIYHLVAVPFASLSLFSAMLRDGISAFHQDTLKDARERDLVVTSGLIGVTISAVLLTMAVLYSRHLLTNLLPVYYDVVWFMFLAGMVLVYASKYVFMLRKKFQHYA